MLLKFIARRVLQMIPVLFGVTVIAYGLLNLPFQGESAEAILAGGPRPDEAAAAYGRLGFDVPIWDRYWHWLDGAFHLNLGSERPSHLAVSSVIAFRAPITAELCLLSIVLALVVALPLAVLCALRPGGIADRIVAVVSMLGISTPLFITRLSQF